MAGEFFSASATSPEKQKLIARALLSVNQGRQPYGVAEGLATGIARGMGINALSKAKDLETQQRQTLAEALSGGDAAKLDKLNSLPPELFASVAGAALKDQFTTPEQTIEKDAAGNLVGVNPKTLTSMPVSASGTSGIQQPSATTQQPSNLPLFNAPRASGIEQPSTTTQQATNLPLFSAPTQSGASLPPPRQKMVNEVTKSVATDELKALNEAARNSQKRLQLFEQAETALKGLDTGTFTRNKALLAKNTGLFGGEEYAARVEAADAPLQAVIKTFRVSGEGSSSDKDVELLEKSTAGVENTPAANRFILQAGKAQAQRNIDFASLVETLFSNGYSIPEARSIYKKFVDSNPLFAGGSVEKGLNPNAVLTFEEWVQGGMADNKPVLSEGSSGAIGIQNIPEDLRQYMTPEELAGFGD